jgi:hypothetical protein
LWVVTSTPTPVYVFLWDLPPAYGPSPTPATLPGSLVGLIGFQSNRRGESAYYMMNVNGGNIALFSDNWIYDFASDRQEPAPSGRGYLSPNGLYVVYATGEPGHSQVWLSNADGSNPRNISNNPYDEFAPVWLRSTGPVAPTASPTPSPAPLATPAPAPAPSSPSSPSPPDPTPTPKPPPPI